MQMKQVLSRVCSTLGLLAFTSSPVIAGELPEGGYRVLGGVDLQSYCVGLYGEEAAASLLPDPDESATAYDWYCTHPVSNGRRVRFGIDVNRACKVQYDNRNAYSGYQDFEDPYSWRCVE